MKKKVNLFLFALVAATLVLSTSLNVNVRKSESLDDKVERWRSLNDLQMTEALENDFGQIVKSVSLTRQDIEWLLLHSDSPLITFKPAINASGSFELVVNDFITTSIHSFDSRLTDLENKLSGFKKNEYKLNHENLSPKAKEHLMELQPTIDELERWENATVEERIDAFKANNGDRLRSLRFNKEVLQELISFDELVQTTSFFAISDKNQISMVTMGIDTNGNLMIPQTGIKSSVEYGIFQYVQLCPPFCGKKN